MVLANVFAAKELVQATPEPAPGIFQRRPCNGVFDDLQIFQDAWDKTAPE